MTTELPKYSIGTQGFNTKKEILAYAQECVGPRDHKYQITGEKRDWLFALIQHHPDYKFKTQGRPLEELELWVDWCQDAAYPSWGLMLYHSPSGLRLDDVSFRTAINAI